jgi:hypothetical protein
MRRSGTLVAEGGVGVPAAAVACASLAVRSRGRREKGTAVHGSAARTAALAKLGFAAGLVVQELGWDHDCDDEIRTAVEALTGGQLEDEDYADGADAVLLWFRTHDDDLVDSLVDGLTDLVGNGFLVLCTPRAGRDGHVDPSEIEDAALTAGLHPAGVAQVSGTWSVVRLVRPKGGRR